MKLTREQFKSLEAVCFWQRNKAFYHFDKEQVKMSVESTNFWMQRAHGQGVKAKIVNAVRQSAKEDCHQDVRNILDNLDIKY